MAPNRRVIVSGGIGHLWTHSLQVWAIIVIIVKIWCLVINQELKRSFYHQTFFCIFQFLAIKVLGLDHGWTQPRFNRTLKVDEAGFANRWAIIDESNILSLHNNDDVQPGSFKGSPYNMTGFDCTSIFLDSRGLEDIRHFLIRQQWAELLYKSKQMFSQIKVLSAYHQPRYLL